MIVNARISQRLSVGRDSGTRGAVEAGKGSGEDEKRSRCTHRDDKKGKFVSRLVVVELFYCFVDLLLLMMKLDGRTRALYLCPS